MKKKWIAIPLTAAILVVGSLAFENIQAASADAGTIGDPLVTKSYVDALKADILEEVEALLGSGSGTGSGTTQPTNMTEIYDYIDEKLADVADNGVTVKEGYTIVKAEKGQKIICEESTEFIVRSGEMAAIGNSYGDGLTDITAGLDIKNGEIIGNNHLLLVPRSDGRGVQVNQFGYIMIKGDFTIK